MSTTNNDELLSFAASRLRRRPGFAAADLEAWDGLEAVSALSFLGIPSPMLTRLALCRSPRCDQRFAQDLIAMASYVDVPVPRLAGFYRRLKAIASLREVVPHLSTTMLAAARDDIDEHTTPPLPPTGLVTPPRWLEHSVARFWADLEPSTRYPRQLELPLVLNLPVAIIEIHDLQISTLRDWLGKRRIDVLADVTDRRVRACLVAYSGAGLMFVEADDTEAERRVSLAHEAGHFICDYLFAREALAKHDPGLLDVLDGRRESTEVERIDASLAGLPLGVHTHLLERRPSGAMVTADVAAAEERAEVVAWELLAPRDEVLNRADGRDRHAVIQVLETDFGLPSGTAAAYARYLVEISGGRGRNWLGLSGL